MWNAHLLGRDLARARFDLPRSTFDLRGNTLSPLFHENPEVAEAQAVLAELARGISADKYPSSRSSHPSEPTPERRS